MIQKLVQLDISTCHTVKVYLHLWGKQSTWWPALREKANMNDCIVSSLEAVVKVQKEETMLLVQKLKSHLPIFK